MPIHPRSGRHALPDHQRRDKVINLSLRRGEVLDLARIAEAWRVPVATVAWWLVSDGLARLRRASADVSGTGIALAASRVVAQADVQAAKGHVSRS